MRVSVINPAGDSRSRFQVQRLPSMKVRPLPTSRPFMSPRTSFRNTAHRPVGIPSRVPILARDSRLAWAGGIPTADRHAMSVPNRDRIDPRKIHSGVLFGRPGHAGATRLTA